MTSRILIGIFKRAETWPVEAQEQLAEAAAEIEAGLAPSLYEATLEELAGIDRGLKAAHEARFASDEEVEAIFAKHRCT